MELLGLAVALLIAVLIGFALGAGRRERPPASTRGPSTEVYRGLNFLLNDQPDRAIDAFLHALDVDADTLETHLALGALLRRRGEVEKAIRIHQNLLARTGQLRVLRPRVELELARDYQAAGLFDRAENLLRGLVAAGNADADVIGAAQKDLLSLYERERDWQSAAALARQMIARGARSARARLAHYHCELADAALAANNLREARKALQAALAQDGRCVRALLSLADVELRRGRPRDALRLARRIPDAGPEALGEALDPIERAHRALNTLPEFVRWLERLSGRGCDLLVLSRIAAVQREAGVELMDVGPALRACIEREPTLAGLRVGLLEGEFGGEPEALLAVVERLLQRESGYRCAECGFTGQRRDWQCPSCRSWGSLHRRPGEPGFGARGSAPSAGVTTR